MSYRVPAMTWNFSADFTPGEPTVLNAPTPEGAALGREVARLADVSALSHPDVRERCRDCAARLGTVPNQCPGTLMDLLKCAAEDEPFYCHLGVAEGEDPGNLCAGYLLMKFKEPRP